MSDDGPAIAPTDRIEREPAAPPTASLGIVDVAGKVVLIRLADDRPEQRTIVGTLGRALREAGAAVVVALTPGTELTALSDEALAKCGLMRIPGPQSALPTEQTVHRPAEASGP